ncbi:MAG: hypothetical protein ABIO39_02300 [Caulobacteraceae bacterium]
MLTAHLTALAAGLIWRSAGVMLRLNLAVAGSLLAYLALHPRWLATPLDPTMLALAVFEALVATTAVAALRGATFTTAASWAVFSVHTVATLAVTASALAFRITRLI